MIYERCFLPFLVPLVLFSSFGVRASAFWPPFKNKANRGGNGIDISTLVSECSIGAM